MWIYRQNSTASDARIMDSAAYSLRLEQYNGLSNMGVTAYGSADTPFGFVAPIGQWIHVTFAGEADGTSLLVNGVLSQKVSTVVSCPRYYLGSIGFNAMVGTLDDVRVFDRVLTLDEIASLAGLGGEVRDLSGNAIDGEFSGTFPSGEGNAGGDFEADFTLAVPAPRVTGMTPPPGSLLAASANTISIQLDGQLDPGSVTRSTVSVAGAGRDNVFGNGDDVVVDLGSVAVIGGNSIELGLPAGLPGGLYRISLSGTEAVLPAPANVWTFDEGTGTTANDSAGPDDGTLGGAGGTLPDWIVGRIGNALRFDGGVDRITTAAPDLPVPWTVALWVKRAEAPTVDARMMDSISFPNGFSLRLEQFNNTNQVGITQYGSTDASFGYSAALGAWTHLTFVGSPGGVSLYADGVLVGSIINVMGVSRHNIGSHGANSLVGTLDDIRVYGVALTPTQIAQLASLGGVVRNSSFLRLDGEFSGVFPSGNGVQGGDFTATFTILGKKSGGGGCGLAGMEGLIILGVIWTLVRRITRGASRA
jgi:hypothetical protein